MSFDRPVDIPGVGTIDDFDIVKFSPSSLGENTGYLVTHLRWLRC